MVEVNNVSSHETRYNVKKGIKHNIIAREEGSRIRIVGASKAKKEG